MKRNIISAMAILAMVSQTAVFAKDVLELDKEANKLQSRADSKAGTAAAEQNESATAIQEGKTGSAAKYAKKAAQEQGVANKIQKKATKVQTKAAEKAVKESY